MRSLSPPPADPATGPEPRLLDPKRPDLNARAFLADRYACGESDLPALAWHDGRFYRWQFNRYEPVGEDALNAQLLRWLSKARHAAGANPGRSEPFPANPTTYRKALQHVRKLVKVATSADPPLWRTGNEGKPDAREMLAGPSSTLHLPTGEQRPATPDLLTFHSVSVDYDPNATRPANWLGFLSELWGEGSTAIDLLQEWFGYCLTPDRTYNALALYPFAPRSRPAGPVGDVLCHLVSWRYVAPGGSPYKVGPLELPGLSDAARGALRCAFNASGRPHLAGKLRWERAGILLWALQGWLRLHRQGRFSL